MSELLWVVFVVNVFWFLIGWLLIPKEALADKLNHLPMYKVVIVYCIYLSPLFTVLLIAFAFMCMGVKTFSNWLYEEK